MSCIQMVSAGAPAPPSSLPLSQRSHHATTSWRKPIAGPGCPRCGYLWLHGPMSPRVGTSSPRRSRNTALEYPSAQPLAANTGQRIAEKSSATEPCLQ
nr:hypothetical protein DA06_08690 [Georgenia sp. SUBG003]